MYATIHTGETPGRVEHLVTVPGEAIVGAVLAIQPYQGIMVKRVQGFQLRKTPEEQQ